ncbi:alpha/beta fold hydrolase [Streptomyces sp. NPDC056149]|uniref:alpha/beta fold hydrolase n=1 Tax=unclassified Streptomyces TaxID=2593676 RepID=UPI002381633F|nr:alpha/beta hydrolase [Streptomyces sp. WZ-12]
MGNVLLVHGAWSDGSIWREVVGDLHDRGHHVLAVQLPMTSLADDIAWTRRHIDALTGPVTLVGHSYGGTVISGAAYDDPRISSLVFVAGYAPDEGETIPMLSDKGAKMPGRTAIHFDPDGWSTLNPEQFGNALAHDLPPRVARTLAAVQKPTHGTCLATPAPPAAWHALPCGYVLSTDDRMLDPGLQQWFATRTQATRTELPTSHLSPLTHHEAVATAITRMLPAKTPRR